MVKSKAVFLVFLIASLAAICLFEVSVGAVVAVKGGDWMEYEVTVTGNPTPMHNITWARLDVKTVKGTAINADFQTMLGNGTLWLEPSITLDVETGTVGEGVIIPTNLTVGDVYLTQHEGNITVTSTQTLQVAGAQRTVLCGEANQTSFCWDKETGVMVKASTDLSDCTVNSQLSATSLWQPQTYGFNPDICHAVVVTSVAVIVGFASFASWRRITKK